MKTEQEEDKKDDKQLKSDAFEDRTKDWSGQVKIQEQLGDIYAKVTKAYDDKGDFNRMVEDCWSVYNCELDEGQAYAGDSSIYVPIVRDAVSARETRFINMLFPKSGRYCDIVTDDASVPYDLIALLDYYSRTTSLRTRVIPAMIRQGDITGQYDLHISYKTKIRHIVKKKMSSDVELPLGEDLTHVSFEDREYAEEEDAGPVVTVLDPRDLVIIPVTVADVQDAEIVAVAQRLSKAEIQDLIDDEEIEEKEGKDLLAAMNSKSTNVIDTGKKAIQYTGIKISGGANKRVLVFQIWCRLKLAGGERRLMKAYMPAGNRVLGCKRCPYWNDMVPVLHQPVEQVGNSIWGVSPVDMVRQMQYAANDAVNMGFDSAKYSLNPIVMTNPESNPRYGSMVMAQAAIWQTNPKETQFVTMPQIWKDALAFVASAKDQIMTSLGVNAAMMPMSGGKKPTQAEVAQQQAVMLESVSDNVSIIKEGMLDKLLRWFYDLDYQFRDKAVSVRQFGNMGLQASLQEVEPMQENKRLFIQWYGFEATKAAMDIQQQISWANTLKGMPPQMLNGRKVDIGPILEAATETIMGPRVGPKVLIDERHLMTVDTAIENEMLNSGFPVPVHPGDPDPQHLQSHMADYKMTGGPAGDPNQYKHAHILGHLQQMQQKAQAQQQQQTPQGAGSRGPRPGATPQPPTGQQNPPGAVHPDQAGQPRNHGVI